MAGCEHGFVTVITTETVAQSYNRMEGDWCAGSDPGEILSVNEITCEDCGESLTKELREEIAKVVYR